MTPLAPQVRDRFPHPNPGGHPLTSGGYPPPEFQIPEILDVHLDVLNPEAVEMHQVPSTQ